MMMTQRENMLRAIRFQRPEHIPVRLSLSLACWHQYPAEALLELMADHPMLFPDFDGQPPSPTASWRRAGEPYVDSWGCTWVTPMEGLAGAVTRHPLESWDNWGSFKAPDPEHHLGREPIDWDQVSANLDEAEEAGRMRHGSLRHGHTFLTLSYIRGYSNLIYDMADEDARLWDLIEMVEGFNQSIVQRYLALGVDMMGYPEDLGMQVGPMLSPAQFKKYVQPVYRRLIAPAREAGCIIHMHSDGDIRLLADDLVEGGVQVLNLQDLVNGIDWIEHKFKGKVCIDLDIDRQSVVRFGTPDQIDHLIREEVTRLGSPEGGLMLIHGVYPGIPLENIRAVMDAMERYATYYA